MLHIYWKVQITNDEVIGERRNRAEVDEKNRRGAAEFPGNIMRKQIFENILVIWKMEPKFIDVR